MTTLTTLTTLTKSPSELKLPLDGWLPDWRDPAMDTALTQAGRDGTPFYDIVRAFRARMPAAHIRHFSEDRLRVLAAFEELMEEFRPFAPPPCYGSVGSPFRPMCGWWNGRCRANGRFYEIALAPDEYTCGEWVIAGDDPKGVEALVQAVLEHANRLTSDSLCYSNGGWSDAPAMREQASKQGWEDIVLAPTLLAEIRAAVEGFFHQREIYHRMGFAWRRGVLLVGPPGTGKTMVCKAAASANPDVRFLYVRDLNGSRNDAISEVFKRARSLAPCILAIEDMDGLVSDHNRTVFLNELDGFRNNDGILIIASSNHPEKIDEALLKRPSRFDRVYHIGLPAAPERTEYVRRLLALLPCPSEKLDHEALATQVAAASEGFTPAYLKEAVLSALLNRVQTGVEDIGPEFIDEVLEQVRTLKSYLKMANDPAKMAEYIGGSGDIGFRTGR